MLNIHNLLRWWCRMEFIMTPIIALARIPACSWMPNSVSAVSGFWHKSLNKLRAQWVAESLSLFISFGESIIHQVTPIVSRFILCAKVLSRNIKYYPPRTINMFSAHNQLSICCDSTLCITITLCLHYVHDRLTLPLLYAWGLHQSS